MRSSSRIWIAVLTGLTVGLLIACGDDGPKPATGDSEGKRTEITGANVAGTGFATISEGAEGAATESGETPKTVFIVKRSNDGEPRTVGGAEQSKGLDFAGDTVDFGDIQERAFFISPKDGEDVTSPVRVKLGVEGLIVRNRWEPQRRYGHHHILVDDTRIPDADERIPVDETHIHYHARQSEPLIDLGPGEHTLTLVFGDAHDFRYQFHGKNAPPLTQTITINIVGQQRIYFIEPEDDAGIRDFPFTIKVASDGVDESKGHFVIIWGVYPFPPEGEPVPDDPNRIHLAPGQKEIQLDLKAGGHKFTLLFVGEDNRIVQPQLTHEIDVTVWKPVQLDAVPFFVSG